MENKKTKIISIVAMVALALTVITATYAYFNAQVGDPAAADVKINANTVDTLTFSSGNEITLNLDQESFASGKGNITGNTYASALLTANNKTNTATEHYYLYLNISNNTFTYSIDENAPEIIMTITNSSGTEVTDISSLTHVIVTGANNTQVSGYDITNKSGLITLFGNREITANPSKEEKWNITITFVNYDASQNANAGKSMSAKVMIQKKEVIQTAIGKTCKNGQNLSECIIATENIDVTLYHHDGTLTNGINDGSYRYSGASDVVNNFVCFGTNIAPCPTDNLYRIIGVFGDKVKLIKYDYASSNLLGTDGDYYDTDIPDASYYKGSLTSIDLYHWNYESTNSETNTWSTSLLNKVNLNTNFITNIGKEWSNKIATTTWKVGGNTYANIVELPMGEVYQNEIVNPVTTNTTDGKTDYDAKIGLMYVSDYGYAASSTYWSCSGYNDDSTKDYRMATTSNWMYMGLLDWTISRGADQTNYVFGVNVDGSLYGPGASGYHLVRPAFYLESSITYVSGDGTQSSPIRIN
ncbi:hypothetical protein EGP99_01535 [bacterium]|nr:hypothetical protein [bacterium]